VFKLVSTHKMMVKCSWTLLLRTLKSSAGKLFLSISISFDVKVDGSWSNVHSQPQRGLVKHTCTRVWNILFKMHLLNKQLGEKPSCTFPFVYKHF